VAFAQIKPVWDCSQTNQTPTSSRIDKFDLFFLVSKKPHFDYRGEAAKMYIKPRSCADNCALTHGRKIFVGVFVGIVGSAFLICWWYMYVDSPSVPPLYFG
jgi:hypothetical protein